LGNVPWRHVAGCHGGDAVGLGQGVEDQRLARGMAQKLAQLRFERAAAGAGARLQAVDDSVVEFADGERAHVFSPSQAQKP
jgi:hypothetical protein